MGHEWTKKAVEQPMYSMRDMEVAEKQVRAEVLAAYEKLRQEAELFVDIFGAMPQVEFVAGRRTWSTKEYKALIRLNNYVHGLQPAAEALEELCDEAHAAGAVIAGEQLLKSLTEEGGDFAVDSPLAKVKKRVEELLREERLDEAKQVRTAIILGTLSLEECDKRVAELEKARASEGKG